MQFKHKKPVVWTGLFQYFFDANTTMSLQDKLLANKKFIGSVVAFIATILILQTYVVIWKDPANSPTNYIPADRIVDIDEDEDMNGAMNIQDICIAVIDSDIQILEPHLKTWFRQALNVTFLRDEHLPDLKTKIADFFVSNECPFTIVLKGRFNKL